MPPRRNWCRRVIRSLHLQTFRMEAAIASESSIQDRAACLGCGYALRGLESRRCPECGRAFDPSDPATMNMGQAVRGWAQRLVRRPGGRMYALAVVAVAVSLGAMATAAGGQGSTVDSPLRALL